MPSDDCIFHSIYQAYFPSIIRMKPLHNFPAALSIAPSVHVSFVPVALTFTKALVLTGRLHTQTETELEYWE
jgi:hypothetical protein